MSHKSYLMLMGLLLLLLVSPISAQSDRIEPERLNVNAALISGDEQGQQIDIYFTLSNQSGVPVTNPNIRDARININGTDYTAEILQPQTPLYVTLVLDTSGSMAPAFRQMRDAAASLINQMPPNTYISVLLFDEEIRALAGASSFTNEVGTVANAVRDLAYEEFGGGTCLYDATRRALNDLQTQAPESRRAVVLFTDGRDELQINGDEPCSQSTYGDVVDQARLTQNSVSIYTIGMRGGPSMDEAELQQMAQATGGLWGAGSQRELSELFALMASALSSQRLARATPVCITNTTPQQVMLFVENFNLTLNESATVKPEVACVPVTPTVERVRLRGVQFDAMNENVKFTIQHFNPNNVASYQFQIVDENGLEVPDGFFTIPAPQESIDFQVASLKDGDYRVIFEPLTIAGDTYRESDEQREDTQELEFGIFRATPIPTIEIEQRPPFAEIQGVSRMTRSEIIFRLFWFSDDYPIDGYRFRVIAPNGTIPYENSWTGSPPQSETLRILTDGLIHNRKDPLQYTAQFDVLVPQYSAEPLRGEFEFTFDPSGGLSMRQMLIMGGISLVALSAIGWAAGHWLNKPRKAPRLKPSRPQPTNGGKGVKPIPPSGGNKGVQPVNYSNGNNPQDMPAQPFATIPERPDSFPAPVAEGSDTVDPDMPPTKPKLYLRVKQAPPNVENVPSEALALVPTDDEPITIGRHRSNTLQIPDPSMSRYHAEIRQDKKGILGILAIDGEIWIDGHKRNRAALSSGMRLQLGNTELEIVRDIPPSPATPPQHPIQQGGGSSTADPNWVSGEDTLFLGNDQTIPKTDTLMSLESTDFGLSTIPNSNLSLEIELLATHEVPIYYREKGGRERLPIEVDQRVQVPAIDVPIGRSPGNVLILEHRSISGEHCLLRFHNGGYILIDNSSVNGTFLNGQQLPAKRPIQLSQNVEYIIAIGKRVQFRIYYN